MNSSGPGYIALALMFMISIILGLTLVWVNIERVDMAYQLKTLERELSEKQEQYSKLQVERQYLLAPANLRDRAEKAGLHPPRRDQIRTLTKE